MRQRSLKLQRAMRVYRRMVGDFLDQHPTCQFPLGCGQEATSVHHTRGRFGQRLVDQRFWKASCAEHQAYAEEKTGAALACGWLLRIEDSGGTATEGETGPVPPATTGRAHG